MSIEMVRDALAWCTVLNFGFLAVWGVLIVLPHEWMYRIWSRWVRLSAEQFDAVNLGGIVLYKIGIFLLNLVPYLALRIIA